VTVWAARRASLQPCIQCESFRGETPDGRSDQTTGTGLTESLTHGAAGDAFHVAMMVCSAARRSATGLATIRESFVSGHTHAVRDSLVPAESSSGETGPARVELRTTDALWRNSRRCIVSAPA